MFINVPSVLQALKPEELTKLGARKRIEKAEGKTAIIICHGMGQQVKFQTLSKLAEILLKKSSSSEITPDKVELVKFEGKTLPRVTVKLKNEDEEKEVHLFETYWAPLTEGRVTFIDVVKFLFSSGWRGIAFSFSNRFRFWMFGKMQTLQFHRLKTFLQLMAIVLILFLIILIYAFAAFLVLSKLVNELIMLWAFVTTEPAIKAFFSYISYLFAAFIQNPRYLVYLIVYIIAIWFLILFRKILIQYPGDVAAYVSSYKLNKFYEIREQIKDRAMQVAHAVYYSVNHENKDFLYSSIIIVGHSLGSVIAYDMLNGIINEDLMLNRSYGAAERTKLFLTFGSPLNKTAFLFRTQIKEDLNTREILAASMQPLICSYEYRPEKWINVWSPMDIISSQLKCYDEPGTNNPKKIENIIDWKSWIPLAAHNQYWKTDNIIEIMFKSIFLKRSINH